MAVNRHLTAGIATVVALSSLLTGCTSTTPTVTPTPTTTVSATPTPTPLSSAEQDLKNAEDAVVRLWAEYDRLVIVAEAPIGDMVQVASVPLLTKLQGNLQRYRANELTGSGETVVEDLTANYTGVSAEGLSTWSVTACVDGTDLDLVDKSGNSVVGPPYRVRHESVVILRDGRFLVAEDESTGTC